MIKTSTTYDVFLAYEHRDASVASEVAEALRGFGLEVFVETSDLLPGDNLEEIIWNALADSQAVVAIIPSSESSSWIGFELGAAKAWNKTIYAIAADPSVPHIPLALRGYQIFPRSRIDEVAREIARRREPMSDADMQVLANAYHQFGIPADQLALQPHQLARLTALVNSGVERRMTNEQVLMRLITLRKRGELPKLTSRGQRKAN